jgi:hypothetical protein
MKLKVATTCSEIIEGWRLVYQQYVRSALIEANPFSVFTYPEYIGRNSAVILGKSGDKSICSVSAVLDSKHRLPLDAYFHDELDSLRNENKKLIEIGLLANQSEAASPFYIIELLSSIARFGVYSNFHDYVIGVHPRRAKFFKHFFGFNQIGEKKAYHTLHDAEVVLLHADGQKFETLAQKASHAIYFEETDLKFDERFRFLRVASLFPYKAVIYFASFFLKLWQLFFPIKNKSQQSHSDLPKPAPRHDESIVTDKAAILNFQSVTTMDTDNGLHSEKEMNEMLWRNLQMEFSLPWQEIEAIVEVHFYHQY